MASPIPQFTIIEGDWNSLQIAFNDLCSLISTRTVMMDNDGYFEIPKQGNSFGDDNNWGFKVDSSNNFVVAIKSSGSWVDRWKWTPP